MIKNLKIELHPDKSKIISLSKGVDFVGFRNFYYYRLLRRRNIKSMLLKIMKYKNNELDKSKFFEIFQGWKSYAKWANSYKLMKNAMNEIYKG